MELAELALGRLSPWAEALPPGPERTLLGAAPYPDDAVVARVLRQPAASDVPLVELARALRLGAGEVLAVALSAAVESRHDVGRALALLQAPVGGSRPTLGLLSRLWEIDVAGLASGGAVNSGLLRLTAEEAPLAERGVAVPLHLLLPLGGQPGQHPAAELDPPAVVPLPGSLLDAAARYAAALGRGALVIRTGTPAEGRAVATATADALGRRPLFVRGAVEGLVPWLLLSGLVPVFERRLGPGERFEVPALPGYDGPMLVLAGPDGSVSLAAGEALSWRVPVPTEAERASLWARHVDEPALAARLARIHRHGSGRIAELGRLAGHRAALEGRDALTAGDLAEAAWAGEGGGLAALAQPMTARIDDDALVVPKGLREALALLLYRCEAREGLARGLGVTATARYHPGVRALFVGPSGTGKTLAAAWLATRLGMPLYRVDVASVVSKFIGETEKNLAELLARAEHAEVVLLFDEADSLFGKRTDVRHATDRYANAQTNYLLQRIETYEGVAVLTSNSRGRFDSAFGRRLDAVLEFPMPGPEERRLLWSAHLGDEHAVGPTELNRLAAMVDLPGGHVRSVVLCAAALARRAGRPIASEDLSRALAMEYRKLGKPLPASVREG